MQVPWVLAGGGGGPSAAPLVDCGAPFIRDAMRQWHKAAVGLAAWGALLSAGSEMQHHSGCILPGAVEEEIPVGGHHQDFWQHKRVG